MKLFILIVKLLLLPLTSLVSAAIPDTYDYQSSCPSNPNWTEGYGFAACNCTSYAADKLNELWNKAPRFVNGTYYTKVPTERWGDAHYWFNKSVCVGIGVTGAKDTSFTWDDHSGSFNAVFPGDIAYWEQSSSRPVGHVAFVHSATSGLDGKGVGCFTFTDYNGKGDFKYSGERTLCRNVDGSFPSGFPDYFLHIDQDHAYCLVHPDQCPGFLTGDPPNCDLRATGSRGGGSTLFNLKVNDFWVKDLTNNLDLTPESDTVHTGEVLQVRLQAIAKNGDTHDNMRSGKDTIEVDIYVREDYGEWRFLQREYIQATNLPSGATHTEHVDYTVPAGVSEVSFKGKIDAEDEAIEANEGDNWSPVLTFQVNNTPFYDLTITMASITTSTPVPVGSPMGAKFRIMNIGNVTPPMATRSCYDVNGPGTSGLWQTIASDQSDGGTLIPGVEREEEILSLVPAPSVPGVYQLRITANCTNGVPESDYANNYYYVPFEVRAPAPDFIVTAVGPAGGSKSFKAGTRIYPAMYIKNIGNANSPRGIRSKYEYLGPATGGVWAYITDDGTDAGQLCIGCQYREQYDGGMKISIRGTYYFRGCADYQNAVAEWDETNNCTVSGPITIY